MNVRAVAAGVLAQVTRQGRSLDALLPQAARQCGDARDRAFLRELCSGSLRWYHQLAWFRRNLLREPLKPKDADVDALLLVGLYQLHHLRTPPHAAVGETAAGARALGKPWAVRLVNGVLRNFERQADALSTRSQADLEARCSHPRWLVERLGADWPSRWEQIVAANNCQAPMALRVNRRLWPEPVRYLARLQEAGLKAAPAPHVREGLVLETPCNVSDLPGFDGGEVSVQDVSAQLAARLLKLEPGLRVLDACAAPGGKTAHMLELAPGLAELVALDISEHRLAQVRENLHRLNLRARLVPGDATDPASWWDGAGFDRILIDAPCSGTGVIRRHPDIKLLRRPTDIGQLALRQTRMIRALWPLLRPGGILLYATCSVLKQENEERVAEFLAHTDSARELVIEADWGHGRPHGRQLFPEPNGGDGFYYARLQKTAAR